MNNKVTVDKFGDSKFKEMYELSVKTDRNTFIKWCEDAINNYCVSSRAKKDAFIRSIRNDRTVDKMVQRMTNIMLAGEGLAVGT